MLFQTSLYDHLKIEYSNTQMPSVAKRSQQFSNIWDTFIPIFSYVFARILEMFKIRWWLNEVYDRDTVLASKIFMELT